MQLLESGQRERTPLPKLTHQSAFVGTQTLEVETMSSGVSPGRVVKSVMINQFDPRRGMAS